MQFGWKARICIVLSALWLCLVFAVANDGDRLSLTLGLGVLPLGVIWGIAWAVAGWRAQRPPKVEAVDAVSKAPRGSSWAGMKTSIAVAAIGAAGLFAASWQFSSVGEESNDLARWFGTWLVYGLFAYVLSRFVPKVSSGMALLLATSVVVFGINWQAYEAVSEIRQFKVSLARAAPLFSQMLSGKPVSDKEVKDAQIGFLEPLLIAQATTSREVVALTENYHKAAEDMKLGDIFVPANLALPERRFQLRMTLKHWEQVSKEYKVQMDAATARGKLASQAALSSMPKDFAAGAASGIAESADQNNGFVSATVAAELDAIKGMTAILDLLDGKPNGFVLGKGQTPNLLFREESMLAAYRQHFNKVVEAGARQQQERERFLQWQTSRVDRLGGLFSK